MRTPHTIESARIKTQTALDAAKTHSERNRLGQFATPPQLALGILRQTKRYFGEETKIKFLDPAFGTGAFYSALLHTYSIGQIESACGFEIDPHYGDEAERLWGGSRLSLQIADFFGVKPPAREGDKPNLLICNPPYVRHHHLPGVRKQQIGTLVAKNVGIRVNGLSGLYCYFLLYAHNWLVDGGLACWLIPSEFMDVNYGVALKEYLIRKVTLLRIHRFDPEESQFDDALVSSVVIWFKKAPPSVAHKVEFSLGGSFENPHVSKKMALSDLSASPKWSRFTNGGEQASAAGPRLSDFFNVKRGLATGANEFFIVNEEEIKKHRLPARFLIPILPSPRFLKQDVVEADKNGNPMSERELFLLSCDLPPHEVKKGYPSLWNYLESGREKKIHDRYLSRHRAPWYAQEKRPASPFLCTYMGRHDSPRGTPFRFILNHSKATAANVYLFLYPKPALRRLIDRRPDLIQKVWEALSKISPESLVKEGRVYGGGLHKLEPRELANAPADGILAILPDLRSTLSANAPDPLQEILI